ncbi:acyl-CoA thioesterase [Robertmurraya andreesenii]|uniref:YbgC/YbaW family acyl-CoA thioester hydrolase n=1 Tax=Anoxybacillus andreesenii TaxID=1325932 RepID=A0ABT9V6P1_9BACL|nr:thioesterase family protein [Robertmurraya andreesenii]MDQ0156622.1 YbgC/YbaW family acyl-CoA thioester hydrolase [Robertmurraya andreesenii]
MRTTIEIRVKEEDIDALGHVNYNKYISYSERAMGDWHKNAGLDWNEMSDRKIGTVFVNLNVNYIKEARLGEVLRVETIPLKLGTKSFVIQQEIYNERDEKITEFTKKFVMFDLERRQGMKVVDEIARHFHQE